MIGWRRAVVFALVLTAANPCVWSAGSDERESTDASATDERAEERADERAKERTDERAEERSRLVDEHIAGSQVSDPEVLDAMRSVARHEFVPPELQSAAYDDRPLPIGHGQTISQPQVVAFMTEQLELGADSTVFEVGTGSGYQAAVLAEIVDTVHTIEIIEPLAASARERLDRLGYDNVVVHQGDGYYGWDEAAPYDAIIVTAAAGHIPPPLLEQLAPGGRMVIPIGPVHSIQQLILVEKQADDSISTTQLLPVRFVPMTGRAQE
ncbi:MAG: protein-L-isoaspartate(D-aspartate) O-methyltransferase [Spirochaetota bacterium]